MHSKIESKAAPILTKRSRRGFLVGILLGAVIGSGVALGVNYNNLTQDGRTAMITTGLVLRPRTGVAGRTGNVSAKNFSKDVFEDGTGVCSTAGDNSAGPWTARLTSQSSSTSITVTGAIVGDACNHLECAAASSTNQALVWDCKVTAADTAILRVTNASGGTITPKTGMRGVHIEGQ